METSFTTKAQIISEEGEFIQRKEDLEEIAKNDPELNTNYRVVSVIGCQNGGKSTLLNEVFSTQFEVLQPGRGVSRTTKGKMSH